MRVGLCLDPKPCGIVIISVGLLQKGNTRGLPQWFAQVGLVSFLSLIFLSISVGLPKGAASDSLFSAFPHKHTGKRGKKTTKATTEMQVERKGLRNCCTRKEVKVAKRRQPNAEIFKDNSGVQRKRYLL